MKERRKRENPGAENIRKSRGGTPTRQRDAATTGGGSSPKLIRSPFISLFITLQQSPFEIKLSRISILQLHIIAAAAASQPAIRALKNSLMYADVYYHADWLYKYIYIQQHSLAHHFLGIMQVGYSLSRLSISDLCRLRDIASSRINYIP